MTKSLTMIMVIGSVVGTGLLLAACQMPGASQRTSVDVTASPTTDTTMTWTASPSPVTSPSTLGATSNTTVDQDMNSLDSLSKQTDPASLGANNASNANLGL